MKRIALTCCLLLAFPLMAAAQDGRILLPDLSSLADKAEESVDIALDSEMLKSAGQFVGGGKDAAEFNELIKGLSGIYVRSLKFDKPNVYSMSDIDGLLRQVSSGGWKKIVSIRDKRDRVELHLRENAQDGGLLLVATEPNELTIVNIVGKVNLEQLRSLQGRMGIPHLPGIGK